MKKIFIPIKLFFILLLVLFFHKSIYSQSFSVGGFVGGGVISSNSPDLGSFTSSIFIDFDPNIYRAITLRLSFLYAGDLQIILPEAVTNYNPFIKGVSLKGSYSQPVNDLVFLEEAIGVLALNNRVFSDFNEWGYGIVFSLLGGLDLRSSSAEGFKVGLGTEYGLTFNNNSAKYFSLHIQAQYVF